MGLDGVLMIIDDIIKDIVKYNPTMITISWECLERLISEVHQVDFSDLLRSNVTFMGVIFVLDHEQKDFWRLNLWRNT